MGGIPRYALLALAVPPDLPLEFMDGFMTGFLEQAEKFNVTLIGGDTSASGAGLFMSITMLGEQYPDRIIKRSGAKKGDLICVSGTLGDSALGLKQLKAGIRSGSCISRHLDPTPRVMFGQALADNVCPSAMIDLSDGLCADIGHVLTASAKGAKICIDDIPLSAEFCSILQKSSHDYYNLPLSGGEDYELLFTLNPSKIAVAEDAARRTGTAVSVIGEITEQTGLFFAKKDGSNFSVSAAGYDHFPLAEKEICN
jgi:thiamine-monophosphate kinase